MCRGGELFKPAFFEYLVADGDEEKPKHDRLLKEFQQLEDWLGEKGASYFGGDDVCASECPTNTGISRVREQEDF